MLKMIWHYQISEKKQGGGGGVENIEFTGTLQYPLMDLEKEIEFFHAFIK